MEFKSENERLERINNAHLALIGYMGRTIRDKDAEIALLNEQLHAMPVHGQELEAEIGRLKDINKRQDETIGELERKNEDLQDEIAILTKSILAMNGRLPPFVTEPAVDDTSNLRELSEIPSGPMTAGPSKTQRGDQMPMSIAGLSKPTTLTTKDGEWDWEPVRVGKIDKPAIRKVLAEGRRISKGVRPDKCVENQRVKREEGEAPKPSVRVEFKPVKIVSPVRTAARRAMAIEERRLEGKA